MIFADLKLKPVNKMSDEGSDAEVYEVEKLLDKRVKKGKTEYLVKWKGWRPMVLTLVLLKNYCRV